MLGAVFLPQFSKVSNAPNVSINRFKSNKCGIFSSSCVHSPWLREALWLNFHVHFTPWTGFMNVYLPFFQPLTLVLDFHHDTIPALQTLLVLHSPVSSLAWPWLCSSHPASTTFRMLNQSARSSYRTTGFYLWRNKDAPQTGVWAFLLSHGVCTAFSYLFTWWNTDVCVGSAGREVLPVICSPPFSSTVKCNTRSWHKGETQH